MPAIFNLLKRNYDRDLLQSSRKLVSCYVTIEKEYCHLRFNHACKREGVLPKSLRFPPPIKSQKGFQLARNSGWEFLNLRINESHKKIGRAKTLVEIRFQLNSKLHPEEFNDLMNYSNYKKSSLFKNRIHSQPKTKKLISRERETKSLNRNWIKNLSSRSLTNAQESLLKKGNKFAIVPSKIPVLDIISGVELGLSQVNFANKCSIDSTQSKVVEILKSQTTQTKIYQRPKSAQWKS